MVIGKHKTRATAVSYVTLEHATYESLLEYVDDLHPIITASSAKLVFTNEKGHIFKGNDVTRICRETLKVFGDLTDLIVELPQFSVTKVRYTANTVVRTENAGRPAEHDLASHMGDSTPARACVQSGHMLRLLIGLLGKTEH